MMMARPTDDSTPQVGFELLADGRWRLVGYDAEMFLNAVRVCAAARERECGYEPLEARVLRAVATNLEENR